MALKNWLVLSEKKSRSLIAMAKSDLQLVVGLITGRCNISAMTSKWDDEEETETLEHLLCPYPIVFRC